LLVTEKLEAVAPRVGMEAYVTANSLQALVIGARLTVPGV
jgi:hypothetical protein